MKKKVNLVLAGLVLAGLAVFLAVEGAEAFCVYNQTDRRINVEQTGGHKKDSGFVRGIDPGGKECCNWQNKDCNKEGKRDGIVGFSVYYWKTAPGPGPIGVAIDICQDFAIQAGGWLTIEGKEGNYKCVRHDYGDSGEPPMPKPKPGF